jgi:hypothetical protein
VRPILLVNTLAREIIDKMRIAPPEPITVEHVEQAKARRVILLMVQSPNRLPASP